MPHNNFPKLSKKAKSLKSGMYQHFKGEKYTLVCVAIDAENFTENVIYKSISKGYIALRSLENFTEKVIRDGYKGPRFKYLRKK